MIDRRFLPRFSVPSILMALAGLFSNVHISLGFRVSIGELIMFLGMPVLIVKGWGKLSVKGVGIVFGLCALYLISALASDIYNGFVMELFIRSALKPIVIFLHFYVFLLVLRMDPMSILVYVLFVAIGSVSVFVYSPAIDQEDVLESYPYFVFVISPFITAVITFLATYFYGRSKLVGVIAFTAFGVVSIMNGSRSMAIIYLLVAFVFFVFLLLRLGMGRRKINVSMSSVVMIVVASIFALTLVYLSYIYMAPRGLLGEYQQQKYIMQTDTKLGVTPWGILAAGRMPVVALILAIIESPILGLGSWPDMHPWFVEAAYITGDLQTYKILMDGSTFARKSGHSVLLGAWVNSGFFASILYFYSLYALVKTFLGSLRYESMLTPIVIIKTMILGWDIFFSPLGIEERVDIGLMFALYFAFFSKNVDQIAKAHILSRLNIRYNGR